MGKFRLSAIAAGIALTTAFATPSFAIGDAAECASEGGSMVNVKGSDFCLVPIRDEAYAGAEYDGNQLGVVECPGSKLNDGAYCMYPVTLRNKNANVEVLTVPEPIITTTVEPVDADIILDKDIGDAAMEKATDMVKDKAKDAATDMISDKASSAIK